MFRVFSCLTGEHDWRLVVLAGLVCLLASLVAVSLFHRARAGRESRSRHAWLLLAGAATGCGIWATHFIAMLAYQPSVPVAYNIGLTQPRSPSRWPSPLPVSRSPERPVRVRRRRSAARSSAPASPACTISACGHWRLPGTSVGAPIWCWHRSCSASGLRASLHFATRRGHRRTASIAAVLLTLAILAHHFTAMGAVQIVPDPMLHFARPGYRRRRWRSGGRGRSRDARHEPDRRHRRQLPSARRAIRARPA